MRVKSLLFYTIIFCLISHFSFAFEISKLTLGPAIKKDISNINMTTVDEPVLCEEVSSETTYFKGEASVVFFYMGDDELTTFFQELIILKKAFHDYDYKVLLYDVDGSNFSESSSSGAINQADEVLKPTKENFFSSLERLFDEGYIVDLYIISHGNVNQWGNAHFVAMDGDIYGSEILVRFKEYGCGEVPIRMVWSGACYHKHLAQDWVEVGAKVASGSRYINFYPHQFGRFAYKWTRGHSFKDSLSLANTVASRTAAQTYVYFVGLEYSNQGECGLVPNVLGKNKCAKDFFTGLGPSMVGLDEDYQTNKSGKDNMNYSSAKIVSGDKSITRDSELFWNMPY